MHNMFQAMIEHLQQMDDVMEAVKAKLEEGYVIKNDFHQTICTRLPYMNYVISKKVLDDGKGEYVYMQDNIAFMQLCILRRKGTLK